MEAFSFALDTEIHFGLGSRERVGHFVATLGRRAVLVTGGASLDAGGHTDDIRQRLEAEGVGVVDRIRCSGEPDDHAVADGIQRVRDVAADVLVAVGGGSAIDLAKAIAVGAAGVDIARALEGERVDRPGTPVVAAPTTGGSGAEVSRAAIVLDRAARRKRGVRGRGVAARVAIVDPELAVGSPGAVTAESGFDALAHAIETSASRVASPINVALAGEAFRRLLSAVPAALDEPTAVGPRAEAAYAAMLMGVNLATSSTCLPHRLQYPVGAMTGTSHAKGVAAIMPAWLSRTRGVAAPRLGALARAARVVDDAASDADAAQVLERAVLEWLQRTGMRTTLTDLGIGAGDIDELVAMTEGTLANDPGPYSPPDLARLYRASL